MKTYILLLFLAGSVFGQVSQQSFPVADTNGKAWYSSPSGGSNFSKIDESYDNTGADFIYTENTPSLEQKFTIGYPPMSGSYSVSDVSLNIQTGSYNNVSLSSPLVVVVKDAQSNTLSTQNYTIVASPGNFQDFTINLGKLSYSKFPLSVSLFSGSSCTVFGSDNSCRMRVFSLVVNYSNIITNTLYIQ